MSAAKNLVKEEVEAYAHWYHRFHIADGVIAPGVRDITMPEVYLQKFELGSVAGKRILDLATFDGGFAFGFERLGAEVVGQDLIDQTDTGFALAHRHIGSKIKFYRCSVYELDPNVLGYFDLVHYSGLHYHLKHPYLALEKINAVLKDGGVVFGGGASGERYYTSGERELSLELEYPDLNQVPIALPVGSQWRGDPSNWWLLNNRAHAVLFERSGFRPDIIDNRHDAAEKRPYVFFKATKVGEAQPEYFPRNHMKCPDGM